MAEYVGDQNPIHPSLGKAKVIDHIEITICLICGHHRDQHGPEGCYFCDCLKKNNRTPTIRPKSLISP